MCLFLCLSVDSPKIHEAFSTAVSESFQPALWATPPLPQLKIGSVQGYEADGHSYCNSNEHTAQLCHSWVNTFTSDSCSVFHFI